MFECKSCLLLKEENKFLREMNQKLTDQLVAVANPLAYAATQYQPFDNTNAQYFGASEDDEYYDYDQYGQKVLFKKQKITNS